ncbi:PilN domain-containing protein [Thalassotalea sp. PP2-459]|uniref:PilN domain-containing protein n=1 Tax=Thalassotalea sp. PP2-459 TaxID=1742724 RepID=UPI000941F8B5|nr:PilN domain-containing protein [Thalassotalea sp. PP2-459]OKY24656.1 hypothetical protein BI291_05535 [Thalassotalea sp. PP2-459]
MQQANNQASKNTQQKSRILAFIKEKLADRGGYLSNEFYAIKSDKKEGVSLIKQPKEKIAKATWLILGREHYFEVSKVYPIANKRELLKALEYDDDNAPFSGTTLKFIERINEHSHRVTLWVVEPKIFDSIKEKPWLIIPESFLLANALDDKVSIACIKTLSNTLFISKTGQGIVSGIQSANTPSVELFALASGAPLVTEQEQCLSTEEQSDFVALLYEGLLRQGITSLQGFVVKSEKINWQDYPWKEAGIIAVTLFSGYLLLTSGWLVLRNAHLDYALTNKAEQVNESLSLQKAYQTAVSQHKQLQAPLQNQNPHWNIWHIALDVIASGAQLKAILYKNETVTIQGWANEGQRATDILSKLTKNPYLMQPSFSKPVRKSRGREEFSISFTLNTNELVKSSRVEPASKQALPEVRSN